MNTKRYVTFILLLFVALSIGKILLDQIKTDEQVTKPVLEKSNIVVYYFHGNKRCTTCNTIEKYTQDAILQNFKKEVENAELRFDVINVENSENEHFISDFQLSMKTVVIAHYQDGKLGEWRKMDQVWQLVRNQNEFENYIKTETQNFLGKIKL